MLMLLYNLRSSAPLRVARRRSGAGKERMKQCVSRAQSLGRIQHQRLFQQVDKVGQQLGVVLLHLEQDVARRDQTGLEFTGGFGDDQGLDRVLSVSQDAVSVSASPERRSIERTRTTTHLTGNLVLLHADKVHRLVEMHLTKLSLLDHLVIDFALEVHHEV